MKSALYILPNCEYFVDFVIACSGYGSWQPGMQCSGNYSLGQCICWTGEF